MRQCEACRKKLYKNYRKTDVLRESFHLCHDCGTVSFRPWPSEETVQGRLLAIHRRDRGDGRQKTLTIHTEADPRQSIELRDLRFENVPHLPPGLGTKAKVLRVRPLYSARPPKKKKKKAAEAGTPEAPAERYKKKLLGYSVYAAFA